MTKQATIWHVTMSTGHGKHTPRPELPDGGWQLLREHLTTSFCGRAPIPKVKGYNLIASRAGSTLLATVLAGDDEPLATFGVASHTFGAGQLWRLLHREGVGGYRTHPADIPAAPWCAVRFEEVTAEQIDVVPWLAGYQMMIAWAWCDWRETQN